MRRIAAVAGGIAAAAAIATPSGAVDTLTNPDWLKRPSAGQFMQYWPTAALKKGQSGRVLLACEISTEGALRKCLVEEETPAGLGFGQAALGLSTLFRFKPGTRNGQPVSSSIQLPIRFDTPSGPPLGSHMRTGGGRKVAMLTKPLWLSTPLRADVEQAYPAKLRAAPVRGAATLACGARADGTLQDCDVEAETPKGRGFGPAARSLAAKFQLAPMPAGSEVAMTDVRVRVPVQFDPPGSSAGDVGGARLLGAPNWRSLPDAQKIEASFPAAARAARVTEGVGKVNCAVQATGKLADCRVVSEQPTGLGFGGSALLIAEGFALSTWTEEGKALDGTRLTVPIRFVDEEPERAAAAGR